MPVINHNFSRRIHTVDEIASPRICRKYGREGNRLRPWRLPSRFVLQKSDRVDWHFLGIERRVNHLPRAEPSTLKTDRECETHRENGTAVTAQLHFQSAHAIGKTGNLGNDSAQKWQRSSLVRKGREVLP